MRLRYAGVCRICTAELPAKAEAIYERTTKTVRCLSHEDAPVLVTAPEPDDALTPIDIGIPGASARREFERRQAKREKRIREKNPKLGGLILALSDDPQSTTSWKTGAVGEERVGQRLNELATDSLRVLHDRRIPGSRANVDHLVVTPNGVFVVDPKRYAGRPHLRVEGGLVRPRVEKLTRSRSRGLRPASCPRKRPSASDRGRDSPRRRRRPGSTARRCLPHRGRAPACRPAR